MEKIRAFMQKKWMKTIGVGYTTLVSLLLLTAGIFKVFLAHSLSFFPSWRIPLFVFVLILYYFMLCFCTNQIIYALYLLTMPIVILLLLELPFPLFLVFGLLQFILFKLTIKRVKSVLIAVVGCILFGLSVLLMIIVIISTILQLSSYRSVQNIDKYVSPDKEYFAQSSMHVGGMWDGYYYIDIYPNTEIDLFIVKLTPQHLKSMQLNQQQPTVEWIDDDTVLVNGRRKLHVKPVEH